jgi:hypothetical protein
LLIKFTGQESWEMRLNFGKRSKRTLMASIMLVAFASRMLIPPGFMPASGRPFLMEICWEGLPAGLLAQVEPSPTGSMDMESMGMDPMPAQGPRHHSGSPSDSEHCVFGTACSAGPIPHLPLAADFTCAVQLRPVAFASIAVAIRVVHLPQPRAPPSRLS